MTRWKICINWNISMKLNILSNIKGIYTNICMLFCATHLTLVWKHSSVLFFLWILLLLKIFVSRWHAYKLSLWYTICKIMKMEKHSYLIIELAITIIMIWGKLHPTYCMEISQMVQHVPQEVYIRENCEGCYWSIWYMPFLNEIMKIFAFCIGNDWYWLRKKSMLWS